MKTLVVGGSRFVGRAIAERLLNDGHEVSLLRRGASPPPFPGLKEYLGDRSRPEVWRSLPRSSWDLVVDACAYTAEDTRLAVSALKGRVGRFVNIGTGQVYLVLKDCPTPTPEAAFAGVLMDRPEGGEGGAWDYGVGKREGEKVLFEAQDFPFTTLRLPVMQGPRDHKFRLHAYVRRALDGGPVLLPKEKSGRLRHLFIRDAAACAANLSGGLGKAYNLAMLEDSVTLPELVREVFRILGREPEVLEVPSEKLAEAGIPEWSSPLSGSWISFLDPSAAVREIGFKTTPWKEWLAQTVAWVAADLAVSQEPGYERRSDELKLAARL